MFIDSSTMYLQEKDIRKNLSVSVVWDVNHSVLQAKNIRKKSPGSVMQDVYHAMLQEKDIRKNCPDYIHLQGFVYSTTMYMQ